MKFGKNSFFFINHYKNHILYCCHGNKYGKKYTCKKNTIWISGYHFMMLWKGYQNFDFFFTKFRWHIWSDTPAHSGWNTWSCPCASDIILGVWEKWTDDSKQCTLTCLERYKAQSYQFCRKSLRWRHNGRDGVSNHQPRDCLLNRLFVRKSKKTSKLCVNGLCVRNSPGTGEFPAQMASNAENVSIWWRHHDTRSRHSREVQATHVHHRSCDWFPKIWQTSRCFSIV